MGPGRIRLVGFGVHHPLQVFKTHGIVRILMRNKILVIRGKIRYM
jgi:hypothetical protein